MTRGRITPIIIGIVPVIGAHIDIAVPMVPVGVRTVVEEEIVRGWLEPAAVSSFIHAVADEALDMWSGIGDPTMRDWSRDIEIVGTIGWITVTESAVEVKGRH